MESHGSQDSLGHFKRNRLCCRPLIPVNIIKSFSGFQFIFLVMDVLFNCFSIIEIELRISASNRPKVEMVF